MSGPGLPGPVRHGDGVYLNFIPMLYMMNP